MTIPSDHTTGFTAWQAVLAAFRDAWKASWHLTVPLDQKFTPRRAETDYQ